MRASKCAHSIIVQSHVIDRRLSPCARDATWRQAHHGRATDAGLERAGSLLSWITGAGEPLPDESAAGHANRPARSGTFAPHADKANRPSYDVSALLYLTSAGATPRRARRARHTARL